MTIAIGSSSPGGRGSICPLKLLVGGEKRNGNEGEGKETQAKAFLTTWESWDLGVRSPRVQ
jgi:hypothetical protein